MLFKDAKQNSVVYVFDRNNIKVEKGLVVSVSFPHISSQINTPNMVVDVSININGDTKQYEIKDTAECVYVGSTLFTTNLDLLLEEIRAIQKQSEDVIASIDKHKDMVTKCTQLLEDIDPVYKKEQESEKRLSKLETSIEDLNNLIKQLLNKPINHD